MKKRHGYVSNSSSTSFCISGVAADEEEWKKHLPEGTDVSDFLWDLQGVTVRHQGECCPYYAGISIDEMGQDETLAQFNERVTKLLKEAGIPQSLLDEQGGAGIMYDGWYNG